MLNGIKSRVLEMNGLTALHQLQVLCIGVQELTLRDTSQSWTSTPGSDH